MTTCSYSLTSTKLEVANEITQQATQLRGTASGHARLTVSKNRHIGIANSKIMEAPLPCGKGLPRIKYLSDGMTVYETLA